MQMKKSLKYPVLVLVNVDILSYYTVAGSYPCLSPEMKCDFVCDCSDCRDEQDCGKFKNVI